MATTLRGNPTALTLLRAGCTIVLPSGYRLHGDVRNSYIDLAHEFGSDGLRLLNSEGVRQSFDDAAQYERDKDEV